MDTWLSLAVGIEAAASLLLVLVALRAWRHTGSSKVLLLAFAFTAFLGKGLLFSVALFGSLDWRTLLLAGSVLDVLALALLYAAVLRRS